MKATPLRLTFYISDLMIITGRSESTARKMMKKMREYFKLKPHQDLTYTLVAEYMGIPEEKLYTGTMRK